MQATRKVRHFAALAGHLSSLRDLQPPMSPQDRQEIPHDMGLCAYMILRLLRICMQRRLHCIALRSRQAHFSLATSMQAPMVATGFTVVATKWLIVVRLLLGEIPERVEFQQAEVAAPLLPYLALTHAVRGGDVQVRCSVCSICLIALWIPDGSAVTRSMCGGAASCSLVLLKMSTDVRICTLPPHLTCTRSAFIRLEIPCHCGRAVYSLLRYAWTCARVCVTKRRRVASQLHECQHSPIARVCVRLRPQALVERRRPLPTASTLTKSEL